MPRKYSGPLMPGKKSAYVKGARKNKPRRAKSKVGLNTVEKKQVKNIVASRKELKYTNYWYNYDNYNPANYTATQLPMLTAGITLPNVYDVGNGTSTLIGLQTGAYLNSASA